MPNEKGARLWVPPTGSGDDKEDGGVGDGLQDTNTEEAEAEGTRAEGRRA